MAYASGDRITASDYNNFVNRINKVWGERNGDYGYGQPELPTIARNTVITEKQWDDMVDVITKAGNHQGTTLEDMFVRDVTTTLPSPTKFIDGDSTASRDSSKLIHALNAIDSNITLIDINRRNVANYDDIELNPDERFRVTTKYYLTYKNQNNTGVHRFRISFDSGNDAISFFNSGGSIILTPRIHLIGHVSNDEQSFQSKIADESYITTIDGNTSQTDSNGWSYNYHDITTNGGTSENLIRTINDITFHATKNSSGAIIDITVTICFLRVRDFGVDYSTLVTVRNPLSTYLQNNWGSPRYIKITDNFPSESITTDTDPYRDFVIRVRRLWNNVATLSTDSSTAIRTYFPIQSVTDYGYSYGQRILGGSSEPLLNHSGIWYDDHWTELKRRIITMANHQGTTLEDMTGITRDDVSSTGLDQDQDKINLVSRNITAITTNRLKYVSNITPSNSLNPDARQRITPRYSLDLLDRDYQWIYRRHTYKIKFSKSGRAFFNAGGRIELQMVGYHTDSSPTQLETDFVTFLTYGGSSHIGPYNVTYTDTSRDNVRRGGVFLPFTIRHNNGYYDFVRYTSLTSRSSSPSLILRPGAITSYDSLEHTNVGIGTRDLFSTYILGGSANDSEILLITTFVIDSRGTDDTTTYPLEDFDNFAVDYMTHVKVHYPSDTYLENTWGVVTTDFESFE